MRWLLLLLTLVSVVVTLQVTNLLNCFSRQPRFLWRWVFGARGEHLHGQSPPEMKDYFLFRHQVGITLFWVAVSLALANETYKAFMD